MNKRRHLFGIIFLLLVLLVPNSAIASPGAFASGSLPLATALDQLFELVTTLLTGQSGTTGDELDGRCSADPWGCPSSDESDLGHGMDPWG